MTSRTELDFFYLAFMYHKLMIGGLLLMGSERIRITKKNRQHNGQKKINKRTNNDLQNIHIKLKIE